MLKKDDWRLRNDVEYLKKASINPTNAEEMCKYTPHLKHCTFCFEPVQNNLHHWWFVPCDLSCCICEECYHDLRKHFGWKQLDGWDIEWFARCPKCEEILHIISSKHYVYECSKCYTLYSKDLNDSLKLD